MTEASLDSFEGPTPRGVAYDRATMSVSEWSDDICDALKDWPKASRSQWEWWRPGYLVLKITDDEGRPVESAWMDTCDDELTVNFGMWETHLPSPGTPVDDELALAVAEARQLVEDWFACRLLTVVFFKGDGKWCGSLTSLPDELDERLAYGLDWIGYSEPKRVEVRSAQRDRWRFFTIEADDKLVEQISG
jgi:hypothetical protein